MNRKNRKCPYCKSKVSYFGALSELNSGEHTCRVCYKNSNISFSKTIYIPAAVLLVLSLAVAAMFFVFKIITNLILALVLILIPFAVFYFLTPLFYRLEEIQNEAQTPVVMYEPKRVARAEKQSRTLKSDEAAKTDNVKKEKKSNDAKNTGESKLSKFIKTYIIVPDDEDEEKENKSESGKKTEKKTPAKQPTESVTEIESKIDVTDENDTAIIEEPLVELDTEIKVPENPKEIQPEVTVQKNEEKPKVPETKSDEQPKLVENIPKKSDDKPKLNFSALFSKLNFSDNKKTESSNLDMPEPAVEVKVNPGDPVYHKLTKTSKVNFVYFPDKKAVISVDINTPEVTVGEEISAPDEAIEVKAENSLSVENEKIDEEPESEAAKAIEIVVEKALEAEKDNEENRQVMDFFTTQPSESKEKEFSENLPEIQNENSEEVVHDDDEFADEDWIEYFPEKGDFITLKFDEPKKENISKNSDNQNNIISLSDVSFDIPESENIQSDDNVTEDNFIEYEAEDKLPVIVVSDLHKKTEMHNWSVFSANTSDFENNSSVPDKESDLKREFELFSGNVTNQTAKEETVERAPKTDSKEKSEVGFFSKYVSKIKSESFFNLDKLAKSVDSVLKNEVEIHEPTETPTDILEFTEDIPEEVAVNNVIKFQSTIDIDGDYHNAHVDEDTTDEAVEIESDVATDSSKGDDNVDKLNAENVSVVNEVVKENIYDSNNLNDELTENFSSEADSDVQESDSTELTEIESLDEELEIFKPEEFMYDEFAKDEQHYKFNEDYEVSENDEVIPEADDEEISENDEEYFKFDESEDEVPEADDEEISENDEEYFKFDESEDEVPEADDEEISENDEEYFKFDESEDEVPEADDEEISENNEENFKFDEEDDEEPGEAVEGAIEYIPDEKNDDSFVVDYSDDKDDFEDISSGEQLDESFNLDEFRVKSNEESAAKEPVVPVKIDSRGNKIGEPKHPSRYEKKFPNAAKAAAEEAAALELKKQREKQKAAQANKKKSSGEAVKKENQNSGKKKDSQKSKKSQSVPEQKSGFLSGLKNKIIEATEEERQAAFEEEERERKLAEKEARRKAKEKEKERAQKQKTREEKEKLRSSAEVSAAKETSENPESLSAEERKKKSQKTKRIEKSKVRIPSDIPADGKTIVFESSNKKENHEYETQEKIVLDSVKDKVRELESKKVTEAEKVKIISEKVDEEKRREKIEKLKNEQEQQRIRKEKKRREKQLRNERLEKAEEIRREQVEQVRKELDERNKSEEKRDTSSVSLKEVDNVRSKVSQKKKKRKQEIDEVL